MLPWYHAVAEYSLLRLPAWRCLEARLGVLDPAAWEAARRPDRLEAAVPWPVLDLAMPGGVT
jgi:hypothetical protein